jgi:RNA polymerase sigma-70 factor (ECF subfamily)
MLHLDQVPDTGYVETSQEKQWRKEEVWATVVRLPKKQRLVVMMRISQALSFKDIGNILDMTEGSAKVNYHHGIKRVKLLLGKNK